MTRLRLAIPRGARCPAWSPSAPQSLRKLFVQGPQAVSPAAPASRAAPVRRSQRRRPVAAVEVVRRSASGRPPSRTCRTRQRWGGTVAVQGGNRPGRNANLQARAACRRRLRQRLRGPHWRLLQRLRRLHGRQCDGVASLEAGFAVGPQPLAALPAAKKSASALQSDASSTHLNA